MALARGLSQVCSAPLTLHTKTAIYVAELMTGVRALGSRAQRGLSQTNKHSLCGVKPNQVALHALTLWPDVTVGCMCVTQAVYCVGVLTWVGFIPSKTGRSACIVVLCAGLDTQ